MKFAQWFNEVEQQPNQEAPLPDARQFSYIACVLDIRSQENLEGVAKKWFIENYGGIPPNWSWRAHHMTVLFRKSGLVAEDMETYRKFFGQDIKLIVAGIAAGDTSGNPKSPEIMAVVVRPQVPFPMMNAVPHITVAHSRAVGPDASNALLTHNNLIRHIDTTELNSVFAAVNKDQRSIWPEKSFDLAIPVKVN
jgi:hypothetical protein